MLLLSLPPEHGRLMCHLVLPEKTFRGGKALKEGQSYPHANDLPQKHPEPLLLNLFVKCIPLQQRNSHRARPSHPLALRDSIADTEMSSHCLLEEGEDLVMKGLSSITSLVYDLQDLVWFLTAMA